MGLTGREATRESLFPLVAKRPRGIMGREATQNRGKNQKPIGPHFKIYLVFFLSYL